VCAGSLEEGTLATTASDVYMVGGLAYELLTAGITPFHWLVEHPLLFTRRRASRDPVAVPGLPGVMASGLYGKSVLEVAAVDGIGIPWCVRVDGSPGSPERLEALKAVVVQCFAEEPGRRPKVAALLETVTDLLTTEVAEVGPAALDSEAQRVAETTALREELAQAHALHTAAVAALASTVAGLESQLVDSATRHATDIAAVQVAATASASRHAAEVAALHETITRLIAENADLQQAAASSTSRHAADMASLETRTSAEVAAHREQHTKALAESARARRDVEVLAQEAQSVRGALAEALRSRDAHVREKDALTASVAQLRQQLASMESVSAHYGWAKVRDGGLLVLELRSGCG
jgi:hypothetical protein